MSNFAKTAFCRQCNEETEHYWLDNTPTHYKYSVKCSNCNFTETEEERGNHQPSNTEDDGMDFDLGTACGLSPEECESCT